MNVRMLPGAERPEGALGWLAEVLGNGKARGVIVAMVNEDGTDTRVFGDVRRYEFTYVGAVLTHHAMNGEFE